MGSLRSTRWARQHRWALVLAGSTVLLGGSAAALGALGGGEGGLVAAGDGPPPHQRPDSALRDAPWLRQPDGSPSIDRVEPQPSLRMPAGASYRDALNALYVSALERGGLPAGATLGPPLPPEVVLVDERDGLRLSLTAPWGWDLAERAIRPPSVRLPGSLNPVEVDRRVREARAAGRALPQGAEVDVPNLAACQVALEHPANRPPCPLPAQGELR